MQSEIKSLNKKIENLKEMCVEGTTTYTPSWTDKPIQKYILTKEGEKTEKCKLMTMDEVQFTKMLWKKQNEYFNNYTKDKPGT